MALLHLLEVPHPDLRNIAEPVEVVDDDIRQIAANMLETMYAENGVGLAAIQVNIKKRIVVMDLSDTRDQPQIFINPEIVEHRGMQNCKEGCLSVPETWGEDIPRFSWVKARFLNEKGESMTQEGDGLFAQCMHHETDHLEGKLFIDYLSPLKRNRILTKLEKIAKQKLKNRPL
jgi:peptide deformylase